MVLEIVELRIHVIITYYEKCCYCYQCLVIVRMLSVSLIYIYIYVYPEFVFDGFAFVCYVCVFRYPV